MLDRLTVRGFKSIRVLEAFELRSLNVLVGDNGAGKSNLLDALEFLGAMADGTQHRVVEDAGGSARVLYRGKKTTQALELAADFPGGSYRARLVPACDRFFFSEEERRLDGRREIRTADTEGGNYPRARLFPFVGRGRVLGSEVGGEVLAGWPHHHFVSTGRQAGVGREHEVRGKLSLRADGSNLGPYLRWLSERHQGHYRDIVAAVRGAAQGFGDLVYDREAGERMGLEFCPKGDLSPVFGSRQVSGGVFRFACLATLLLQPTELQPGVILIELPESGLHPRALGLVSEMVRAASDDRQVVVSTQSADLVSEFDAEDIVIVNCAFGESTFERLDKDDLEHWLEEYPIGELWKANIIGGPPVGRATR